MGGNSLKSEILPVIAMGGQAVYIPYETTWVHERVAEEDLETKQYIISDNFSREDALKLLAFVDNLLQLIDKAKVNDAK
jgi:hypothetical protein